MVFCPLRLFFMGKSKALSLASLPSLDFFSPLKDVYEFCYIQEISAFFPVIYKHNQYFLSFFSYSKCRKTSITVDIHIHTKIYVNVCICICWSIVILRSIGFFCGFCKFNAFSYVQLSLVVAVVGFIVCEFLNKIPKWRKFQYYVLLLIYM